MSQHLLVDIASQKRKNRKFENEKKKKLGVLKVHLMSLSVMFGEKAKRNFYILCKCAIFLSAKTIV